VELLVWNFTLPNKLSFVPEMNVYEAVSPYKGMNTTDSPRASDLHQQAGLRVARIPSSPRLEWKELRLD